MSDTTYKAKVGYKPPVDLEYHEGMPEIKSVKILDQVEEYMVAQCSAAVGVKIDREELIKALRYCVDSGGMVNCNTICKYGWKDSHGCKRILMTDAADAIEALQAEVERLQEKLCDWCAVCPKERRKPEDCELLSETPVMYGPSEAKMEVQEW